MSSQVIITKASGEKVPFSPHKLEHSLKRAGVSEAVIHSIIRRVQEKLFAGITTKEIYHIAFEILKHNNSATAAKYKLKRAIMELGPSGFPFEKYLAEILRNMGFKTVVGKIIDGHCVTHEIDVIAEKDGKRFMIECKFHNQSGYMSDVKIPLYIQSRFKDVEYTGDKAGHTTRFNQGWVVTNTKFTTDAIKYGNCIGLHLIGWDYPAKGSLRELIDSGKLYPVTCLTTLTGDEKSQLLDTGVVLSKEICNNPTLLSKIGISENRIPGIIKESTEICKDGLS